MPTYTYKCGCGWEAEMFFKMLPSEKLQKGYPCPECGAMAERGIEPFLVGGTQHGGMEDAAAFAMQKTDIGGRQRPVFRDANGKVHEVKTATDIDKWRKSNQIGKPRMVEWKNPITGAKSWVAQRTVMKADPVSGEPADLGVVVRGAADIIPLDPNFTMPSESRTGRAMKNGVLVERDPAKIKSRIVDPETRKPMTMADLWGGPGGIPEGGALAGQ